MQSEVGAPGILLTATLRWQIAARLAIAFADLGCRVSAVCPRQHPVASTRAIQRVYPYPVINPLAGLQAAIASAAPDLIVPCDDTAATHLQQLYTHARTLSRQPKALQSLIRSSLGSPEACVLATARGRLIELAAQAGIRVAASAEVRTAAALDAWLERHGVPAVLKIDGTWGGLGVAIVRDRPAAQRAFGLMASPPRLANAMARLLLDRDLRPTVESLQRRERSVTVQQFIAGTPANRAVACWQGEVLAGISVEAIHTQHPTGPATVVRVCDHPEMSDAVVRLVRRLGVSGLWGVDFMLAQSSGAAYLIEVNPRATPICHLSVGPGPNLPGALVAKLGRLPPRATPTPVARDVIALFPGEWQRDPSSHYLRAGHHDVPWQELALVRDGIERPWSERGLLARARARLPRRVPAAIA